MSQQRPLTAQETAEAVVDCLLKVIPSMDRDAVHPDTSLRSLGLSSLEMLSFVFEVEEHFDVALVNAGLDRFDTVAEAVSVLRALPGAQAG